MAQYQATTTEPPFQRAHIVAPNPQPRRWSQRVKTLPFVRGGLRWVFALGAAISPALAADEVPTLRQVIEAKAIDGLSVSPDGRKVAFRVISRSVDANETRAQWMALDRDAPGKPITLGGKIDPFFLPEFDMLVDGSGVWSPDSSSLYVLADEGGGHQIYRLEERSAATPITADPADITAFSIAPDGRTIHYVTRNDRALIAEAQAREEHQGVHLDRTIFAEGLRLTGNFKDGNRIATIRRAGPPLGPDSPVDAFVGPERAKQLALPIALVGHRSLPNGRRDAVETMRASAPFPTLIARNGNFSVEITPGAADFFLQHPLRIEARMRDGSIRTCDEPFCRGSEAAIREVMINDATSEVVILFEPDFSGRSGLFAWNPTTNRSRRLVAPHQSLDGGSAQLNSACAQRGDVAICVEAGPDQPPRLVQIDLSTGRLTVLFDPNASMKGLYFGRPRFIEWRDPAGTVWSGILMLPKRMDGPRPLVITTYRCRGFPRGNMSNLTPEYPLLERGFAVLCFNQNNYAGRQPDETGGQSPAGAYKATLPGFATIIDQLAAQGIIDRSRVGISGHSFSADAAAYAISHSQLFAAAVTGGGSTLDPWSFAITAPTADSWRKDVSALRGLPRPSQDPKGLWQDVSPALNAQHIEAPLLMQAPENEWLFALQLYTAMQDAGKVADLYVYPHEGHTVGREPAHAYWRGLRSIEWFDIWLNDGKGGGETAPDRARWLALKAQAQLARNP